MRARELYSWSFVATFTVSDYISLIFVILIVVMVTLIRDSLATK